MTIRRSLTPKEREQMLIDQGHQCPLCWESIGPQPDGSFVPFVAEHWTPVALGNDQKPTDLLCIPCADRKTNGTKATTYGSDKHAIAKVKRLALKAAKKWRKPARPMRSRGFDKSLRKKMNGEVVRVDG